MPLAGTDGTHIVTVVHIVVVHVAVTEVHAPRVVRITGNLFAYSLNVLADLQATIRFRYEALYSHTLAGGISAQ